MQTPVRNVTFTVLKEHLEPQRHALGKSCYEAFGWTCDSNVMVAKLDPCEQYTQRSHSDNV